MSDDIEKEVVELLRCEYHMNADLDCFTAPGSQLICRSCNRRQSVVAWARKREEYWQQKAANMVSWPIVETYEQLRGQIAALRQRLAEAERERDTYKRIAERNHQANMMPCPQCGYKQVAIAAKEGKDG